MPLYKSLPLLLATAGLLLSFTGCASHSDTQYASRSKIVTPIAEGDTEDDRSYNPISRSFDPAPPFGSRRNIASN